MSNLRLNINDKPLRDYLDKISNRLEKKDRKAILRKASRPVAAQLKIDTPKDSGSLAKSVKPMTWSRTRDYFVSFSRKPARYNRKKKIATDPFYAAFLNEGWTHTWFPRPVGAVKKGTKNALTKYIGKHKGFIQNATDKAGPQALSIIDREVKKIINNP